MHNLVLQSLEWDTKQLGIPVAKITASSLSLKALQETLTQAKKENCRLLYWCFDESEHESAEAATACHGILTDHKLTYAMDLNPPINIDKKVTPYEGSVPSDALLALAYESGSYSRFRADPHLTEEQFKKIYREWMINSVNKSIASEVFVVKENEKLLGMVTLGEKNHRGDIGLLAVSEEARGKKIGTTLVHAAQHYFIEKNYSQSQVVTQKANLPACRLYEKCGYNIEKTELFFHFWL